MDEANGAVKTDSFAKYNNVRIELRVIEL